MSTTLASLKGSDTTAALKQIRAIADPVERAWNADQLARFIATDKQVIAEANQIYQKAIEHLIDNYEDIRPLDNVKGGLERRAWLAESIRREAKQLARVARDRRDKAGRVLIAPFAQAVAPTNKLRAEARRAYEAGELSSREYDARRAELLEQRHAALAAVAVRIEPADVYKPMGISRARFIQMMDEDPGEPPKMRNASQVLIEASQAVQRLVEIQDEARAVRDPAIDALLMKKSNADVARITGLTTAFIAMLRNPKPRGRKKKRNT